MLASIKASSPLAASWRCALCAVELVWSMFNSPSLNILNAVACALSSGYPCVCWSSDTFALMALSCAGVLPFFFAIIKPVSGVGC